MPESSIAICAASVDPAPPRSEYRPELSVSTPILIFLSCAKAPPLAASASAVPSQRAEILLFMISFLLNLLAVSDAEIGMKLVHVGLQFRVGKTVDDLAVLDNVEAVRHGRRKPKILFDQKNR